MILVASEIVTQKTCCLSYWSHCCDKMPDKQIKGLFQFSLRVSIMVWKLWQLGLKVTSPVKSEKQRAVSAHIQLISLFSSVQDSHKIASHNSRGSSHAIMQISLMEIIPHGHIGH